MNIQLMRNATMKFTYAGKTILTDPMLSEQGVIRSFAGIAPNPTVSLPFAVEEIVARIDGVLVSHTHPDHFDDIAGKSIPKNIPIFCQPEDQNVLKEAGFQGIEVVDAVYEWQGITFTRTGGKHGSGPILEHMGNVSGFVLQAKGEPTVYWVGDSIFCEDVEQVINMFKPDIIITHSGGATIPGFPPIIMDGEQTISLIKACPYAKIVAVHLESLDHCTVSRGKLREMAHLAGISPLSFFIPADGETLVF